MASEAYEPNCPIALDLPDINTISRITTIAVGINVNFWFDNFFIKATFSDNLSAKIINKLTIASIKTNIPSPWIYEIDWLCDIPNNETDTVKTGKNTATAKIKFQLFLIF